MKLTTSIILVFLLSLPLISAYGEWWSSPATLFENEWVLFTLIFVVFFAVTYVAMAKSIAKENTGAAVLISLVVAALIAAAISQKAAYSYYTGADIGSWLFIVAIVIGVLLALKFMTSLIGGVGLFLVLIVSWFFVRGLDPYSIFPYDILTSSFYSIWDFITSGTFAVILVIIFILLLVVAYGGSTDMNKAVRGWLWAKREKKKTLAELLQGQ